MIYKCTTVYNGEVKTVKGNWAGVVTAIYSHINGEEDVRRVSILIGPVQAEMFFGQEVNIELGDIQNKFKIKIETIKPTT